MQWSLVIKHTVPVDRISRAALSAAIPCPKEVAVTPGTSRPTDQELLPSPRSILRAPAINSLLQKQSLGCLLSPEHRSPVSGRVRSVNPPTTAKAYAARVTNICTIPQARVLRAVAPYTSISIGIDLICTFSAYESVAHSLPMGPASWLSACVTVIVRGVAATSDVACVAHISSHFILPVHPDGLLYGQTTRQLIPRNKSGPEKYHAPASRCRCGVSTLSEIGKLDNLLSPKRPHYFEVLLAGRA